MTPDHALLTEVLEASTAQVVGLFTGFEGALVDTVEAPTWCFVPGTRKDRVLLVAHADTVNGAATVKVQWVGGVARLDPSCHKEEVGLGYYTRELRALGGDDRTGCTALLWLLREHAAFGHSVLITTGEERGCTGARDAVRHIGKELAQHVFAVELDRRGARNYVFYRRTSTPGFVAHVATMLPGFAEQQGSFSDIGAICPEVGICGVNIAAGYFGEHSSEEIVVLDVWRDSLDALRPWLAQPKHRAFPIAPEPKLPVYRGRPSGAAPGHAHNFQFQVSCSAMVCEDCAEHWYHRGGREGRVPWQECPVCRAAFKSKQERVVETVHKAEALATVAKGVLSDSYREILKWSVEFPGFLSKRMKRRVNRLLLADTLARQPLFPTAPTAGSEGPFGTCIVCGYKFRFLNVSAAAQCPQCHHNPNFTPEVPGARASHQCRECNQHVRFDVDHAFACSSYPGSTRRAQRAM